MAITTYTAGQVLTAASLNNNFASGGLMLVKTQTIGTAVASATLTSVFSSTYDNYRVVVNIASTSASAAVLAQFGTGTATTTNYKSYLFTSFLGWTSGAATTQTSLSGFLAGYAELAGSNANSFDVIAPNLARNTHANGQYASSANGGFTSGIQTDSTQFTSLTVGVASGTMTGGTVSVYGYAKA
jgi:hypothetical protein